MCRLVATALQTKLISEVGYVGRGKVGVFKIRQIVKRLLPDGAHFNRIVNSCGFYQNSGPT